MKSPLFTPFLVLAAAPLILSSCSARGYAPGSLAAAASRGEISLAAAKALPNEWEVEPGIRLHYFSRGTGMPVLVLHGGPGLPSDDPWPGLEKLTDRYRFFYYHQRGCGRSTRPVDRFGPGSFPAHVAELQKALGIPAHLADIERIRKTLGVEKLILAGHSFGGFLAALYAAEFPEHVAKLLLIAPADLLRFPPPDGGLYEQVKRLLPKESLPAYQDWLRHFFDFGSLFGKSEADLVALNLAFVPFWEQAQGALHPSVGRTDAVDPTLVGGWVQQGAFFSLERKYDFRDAFRTMAVPTLVIVGDRDPVGAASVDGYKVLPHARFVTIPGSGHFPQRDAPELASLAGEFLGQ